jgi:hypothetical protein
MFLAGEKCNFTVELCGLRQNWLITTWAESIEPEPIMLVCPNLADG